MYFEIGAKQVQGGRDYQEDCFQVVFPDQTQDEKTDAILVLADGMGGHAGGAVAAELVVEKVVAYLEKHWGAQDMAPLFRAALDDANEAIRDRVRQRPELQGMGCTLVLAVLREDSLQWVSVGDSLLYILRNGEVLRQNDDHSYGGYIDRLEAAGDPIPEMPGFSPRRNMLMSYINGEEIAMVDLPLAPIPLQPGDRIIIASDGLDTIDTGSFAGISAAAESPQEFADALIQAVEDAGKRNQDNTTVVVADVLGLPIGATDMDSGREWRSSTLLPLGEDTQPEGDDTPAEERTQENAVIDLGGLEETISPEAGVEAIDLGAATAVAADGDAAGLVGEGEPASEPEVVETIEAAPPPGAETPAPATRPPGSGEGTPPAEAKTSPPPEKPASLATGLVIGRNQRIVLLIAVLALLGGMAWWWLGQGDQRAGDGLPGLPIGTPARPAAPESGAAPQSPARKTAGQATPQPSPATVEGRPEAQPAAKKAPVTVARKVPSGPVRGILRDRLAIGGTGPAMAVLAGGGYLMGSSSVSTQADERPQHRVVVPPFAIGVTEVTFDDYDRFAKASGRPLPADGGWGRGRRPVINVTWQDARDYARWLSAQTRHHYRLPSESEWEFAARAGSDASYWWGYKMKDGKANCWGCSGVFGGQRTAPVGELEANPWGLHDMLGNVLEWTEDCYVADYRGAPADGSPVVTVPCTQRVARGGSWSNPPGNLRAAKRLPLPPNTSQDNLGFRLARDIAAGELPGYGLD